MKSEKQQFHHDNLWFAMVIIVNNVSKKIFNTRSHLKLLLVKNIKALLFFTMQGFWGGAIYFCGTNPNMSVLWDLPTGYFWVDFVLTEYEVRSHSSKKNFPVKLSLKSKLLATVSVACEVLTGSMLCLFRPLGQSLVLMTSPSGHHGRLVFIWKHCTCYSLCLEEHPSGPWLAH